MTASKIVNIGVLIALVAFAVALYGAATGNAYATAFALTAGISFMSGAIFGGWAMARAFADERDGIRR